MHVLFRLSYVWNREEYYQFRYIIVTNNMYSEQRIKVTGSISCFKLPYGPAVKLKCSRARPRKASCSFLRSLIHRDLAKIKDEWLQHWEPMMDTVPRNGLREKVLLMYKHKVFWQYLAQSTYHTITSTLLRRDRSQHSLAPPKFGVPPLRSGAREARDARQGSGWSVELLQSWVGLPGSHQSGKCPYISYPYGYHGYSITPPHTWTNGNTMWKWRSKNSVPIMGTWDTKDVSYEDNGTSKDQM